MEQMQISHYLTFEFAGMQGKFVYMVYEDVKNNVRHELLQRDWEIEGSVIEFEDTSGRIRDHVTGVVLFMGSVGDPQ